MNFASGTDTFSTSMSNLPLDGIHAIQINHDTLSISSVTNNPINFAGDSASIVPEPGAVALVITSAVFLVGMRKRKPDAAG